jgi:prefoldin subunit 5
MDAAATAAGDGRTTLEGAAAPVADEMDLVAPKADTFTTDKLIYTADVALRSYQFDQDYAAILSRIDEAKGYAGSTSVQGLPFSQNEGTGRIGSIEANIPQEQYQSFIEWLSTMGEITSNNQQVTNVSQQYTQVQIRIDSLQKQITRLQELIGKAENVADLIQLETQLSSVTTELEYMQSQMDSLDMQISYSTVNVTLTEMESAQTQAPSSERTFGQRMKDALAQGWKRFTGSLQSWSLGFIKALPYFVLWLVVLAVAIGIVMLVIHTRRRRKKP